MGNFVFRIDDATEHCNIANWERIESLLDKFNIKPLVGIIPNNEDENLLRYEKNPLFWKRVRKWVDKGWEIALHGYNHVYKTDCGGINPVQKRSEFAGELIEIQRMKIRKGIDILRNHGIDPRVFFAPSHTFDENTLVALAEESKIRIISDTIATKPYNMYGFTFIPQQVGKVRNLPFKLVTFCYHPNTMTEKEFTCLEKFLQKHHGKFINFPIIETKRKKSIFDKFLSNLYFSRRR